MTGPATGPATGQALFLRAVSVGGAGRLNTLVLRTLIERSGGTAVRVLDGSGTALYLGSAPAPAVAAGLAAALRARFGREIPVFARSAAQIETALAALPFTGIDPARIACVIHDEGPQPDPQADATGLAGERLAAAPGMLFVHYPLGIARSRLRHPLLDRGTPRSLDRMRATLEALQAMARVQ